MTKYIDADTLIKRVKDLPTWWADGGGYYGGAMKYPEGMFEPEDVISIIENIPAADVAPVRHGRWEKHGSKWQCTGCKVLMSIDGTPQENLLYYCPNCGCKMDKEE